MSTFKPNRYLIAKLQKVVPVLQEARDALTALTEAQRKLHGIDATLAARMDEAGTYSIEDWAAENPHVDDKDPAELLDELFRENEIPMSDRNGVIYDGLAWLASEAERFRLAAMNAEGMAQCMAMLREDMIEAGVIQESVPPMFMTEAILSRIGSRAAADVLSERHRHVQHEGWTHEHDDSHGGCELAAAAATYATCNFKHHLELTVLGAQLWPGRWVFKDAGYRRNLVKAGALIIAEIERVDRLEKKLEPDPDDRGREVEDGRDDGP
jgi:hypothetical protein